jgi:hypothetical protein
MVVTFVPLGEALSASKSGPTYDFILKYETWTKKVDRDKRNRFLSEALKVVLLQLSLIWVAQKVEPKLYLWKLWFW